MVIRKIGAGLFGLFLVGTSILSALTFSEPVEAYLAGFNPGNIMSDYVMGNKDAMTEGQIQSFLKSKNSCNDTDYAKYQKYTAQGYKYNWRDGHFVCMADESFNGESAAHIIWKVAQEYSINPQVLIVLLQKEQGLVTDTWPNTRQYEIATGYGCPDTAPCDSARYGFENQLRWATKLFREVLDGGWSNYPAYSAVYVGYNPIGACGGTNVYIENRATSALYRYTPYQPNAHAMAGGSDSSYPNCGAFGNRNFYNYFTDWFGDTTTPAPTACDSDIDDVVCTWSLRKADGSQFLTASMGERDLAISKYGWQYEGVVFYAYGRQRDGANPVYRLQNAGKYYYTTDHSEYTSLQSSDGWTGEGVAFYAYPHISSTNTAYPVYKLKHPSATQYYWVRDDNQKNRLLNNGYVETSIDFDSPSGVVDLPQAPADRHNIYRSQGRMGYMYTTSLMELEKLVGMGYAYEGVVTTANSSAIGTPVYRLRNDNAYLFTTSSAERESAISSYGMVDEGTQFYLDEDSAQVYRVINTLSWKRLYTSSISEVMSIVNKGWQYESVLLNSADALSPVYRFINMYNDRHFYTIDINEAVRIANLGWKYETIAFNTSKTSGTPIYRLLLKDKHFYTISAGERDIAVSKHGYVYEGIAFYVSDQRTDRPVFRMQGGNDEYFYTTSVEEKDGAVDKYGYWYEGEGFYLQ